MYAEDMPKMSTMSIVNMQLNLRGTMFQIGMKYLKRLPGSLLGKIAGAVVKYQSDQDSSTDEFIRDIKGLSDGIEDVFINGSVLEVEMNRTPVLFHYILDLYMRGSMHLPAAFCAKLVHEEMIFWGVSERKLVTCCWAKLREEQEKQVTLQRVQKEWGVTMNQQETSVTKPDSPTSTLFFDSPRSSRKAWVSDMIQRCYMESTEYLCEVVVL